jgi:hypothetical protein
MAKIRHFLSNFDQRNPIYDRMPFGFSAAIALREWANLDPLPKSRFIVGVYCLKSRVFLYDIFLT